MAFMMKKKKYKFHVELCVEELIEVPFVSAVLFAKVRLLDGGNFQDQSSREEVKEHTVRWNAKFEFPCKMCANANTGVLEACVVRVSVRKECKGGRSFQKLGFCDLNLAEFAGSGLSTRRCLLEGYDARRRQDNSMLRLAIRMNMLQGDILFKVPSPSLKSKAVSVEEGVVAESRIRDDFSSGSLAGSIASGSSGFGSLPKKRPALFNSELLTGPVADATTPAPSETTIVGTPVIGPAEPPSSEPEEVGSTEPGHSRNSSSTSQMSKASGYSSINSHSQHSRQSSSGDSGHIRYGTRSLWAPTLAGAAPFSPASPRLVLMDPLRNKFWAPGTPTIPVLAASILQSQHSSSNSDIFETPETTLNEDDLFIRPMTTVMEHIENQNSHQYETNTNRLVQSNSQYNTTDYNIKKLEDHVIHNIELNDLDGLLRVKNSFIDRTIRSKSDYDTKRELNEMKREYEEDNSVIMVTSDGVIRSKSDFEIPKKAFKTDGFLQNLAHKSDNLFQNIGFLTPSAKRRGQNVRVEMVRQSTPVRGAGPTENVFRVPGSPILRQGIRNASAQRAISLNSLKSYAGDSVTVSTNHLRNPSSGSLALSETGSLDRAKAALERRKKAQAQEPDVGQVSGRVEVTRVNPDNLIAELLKNTNLEPADEIAESSGLQLFIAKDGTAALGNHEVKSQMTTGAQIFKQVVMDNNR